VWEAPVDSGMAGANPNSPETLNWAEGGSEEGRRKEESRATGEDGQSCIVEEVASGPEERRRGGNRAVGRDSTNGQAETVASL